MVENDKKPYWHDAIMAFGRMSGWILGPILASLFLGKWLDTKFHTAPLIFISLTVFSFIVSMIGLVREGQRYMRSVQDSIKKDTHERTESDN